VAIHAEANALIYTDRNQLIASTIYCTEKPCAGCMRLIRAAGVIRAVWPSGPHFVAGEVVW